MKKLLIAVVLIAGVIIVSMCYSVVSRRSARPLFRNKFVRADTVLPAWVFGTWPGSDNRGNFVLIDEALNQIAVIEAGDPAYPIDRLESDQIRAVFSLQEGRTVTIQRQPNTLTIGFVDGASTSAGIGEGEARSIFEGLRLYGYEGGNLIDRALQQTATSRPATATSRPAIDH